MEIQNQITEKSTTADIAKSLQGVYGHEIGQQYWTATFGHICIVQALTKCTISLKEHKDFYFNNTLVSENTNKLSMNKGDTAIYYVK